MTADSHTYEEQYAAQVQGAVAGMVLLERMLLYSFVLLTCGGFEK